MAERGERDGALCLRGDQDFAFAVVDDVCDLIRREEGIYAGIIEAGAFTGGTAFGVPDVVLHEDRIMIEPRQTVCPQQMRQPIAAPL
ncbi:MAG: hypothetical protein WB611_22775 [Stellaceae bacterium]